MASDGSMPDPLVGVRFGKGDRMEVKHRLGQGGMGVVYYAWDHVKERAVAIKVLLSQAANDPEFLRRFKHEGMRWRGIQHEHLCRIYGLGRQHGHFYIVSEFVEGRDLDKVIQQDGAQTVDEALRMIREAASALAMVHQHNIVHRDLKPENLMLVDADRSVKVMDFGLAKYLDSTSMLTMPGDFVGTPGYVAPEHLRGDEMDGRADIFALGAILYELLTARGAFRGKHVVEVLRQNRDKNPIPVTKFNDGVVRPEAKLITQMIEKDQTRRPASMEAVIEEIDRIQKALADGTEEDRKGLGGLLKSFWE